MASATLIERLRSAGIVAPRTMVTEATRAGLKLGIAAAMLEKESRGGLNLFGHDRDRQLRYIFPARDGDVKVTKELYLEYKRKRKATGLCQGVGPCQLTSAFLQDAADEAGGCWKPAINMRIGFRHMASLIKANGESVGARMYNGSGSAAEAYSVDLLKKAARWEALMAGAKVPVIPGAPQLVRRGARGPLVEKITRRLSFVRARATRAPYLDGKRKLFDAEAEAALKAFQREHGLDDDGVFGPLTARKLNRAVRAEKRRQQAGPQPVPATPVVQPVKNAGSRLPVLVARVKKLDQETEDAWASLVAYSRRRRRLLHKLDERKGGEDPAVVTALAKMTEILLRIEKRVGEIADAEEREATAEVVAAAAEMTVGGDPPVAVYQAETLPPPAPEGPVPPAAVPNGEMSVAPAPRRLSDLSEEELLHRVARLDKQLDRARAELIGRYIEVEREIAKLRPPEKKGGGGKKPEPKQPEPGGGGKDGGKVVVTKLGDRGLFVRRSKLALAGYLRAKGNPEHAQLRRRLRREARSPGKAGLATDVWQTAVKAAQHVAGRPVTGELDGELVRILQPFWPRDNAGKRVLRGTGAWRTIPGQLSPNFNIKEFACKDTAHTSYVDGLAREQGISKKQAKERAKELAKRLERLRKLGGDRPVLITSAYRTKAYNASLTGSATNSAHTRGYAVDTPPPRGVSLLQHEQHVLQAFECGVGYYPPGHGNFVHGDFDRTLGGRRRWGH